MRDEILVGTGGVRLSWSSLALSALLRLREPLLMTAELLGAGGGQVGWHRIRTAVIARVDQPPRLGWRRWQACVAPVAPALPQGPSL